ncbi:histidine--tRNA ligase [Candidatus Microgenomates bacterium]|nr:histidine--tRNA ligase [Candidatus Microgenomates bacterium]
MAKEQGPASGFRDMSADQMLPRDRMLRTIEGVYKSYGFIPLDTPAVELTATLRGKYGEEGDQLVYGVKGRGDRGDSTKLSLRYDLTVPLARHIAQNPDISLPFKRYQIGKVWRGDRPQAGRYREFTQFDADTVGAKGGLVDAEVIAMMSDSMNALGADATILINNRRLLDALVEKAGVEGGEGKTKLITAIDNVEKVGVGAALTRVEDGLGERAAQITRQYLTVEGTSTEKLVQLGALLRGADGAEEGIDNLQRVFTLLKRGGYGTDQVQLDNSIARGLSYYTGIIFETRLNDLPQIGSVCSGGRYDNLIQTLGGPNLPAVGTSIGVDRLMTGLEQLGQVEQVKTPSEVIVVNFPNGDEGTYMSVAKALRTEGIATEVYPEATGMKKQLTRAAKLGVPYVVMAGPKEVEEGKATIRDMQTKEQHKVNLEDLPDAIKGLRNRFNS